MFTWVDVCSTQPLCRSRHFVASRINAPAVVVVFTLDHFVTTQRTTGRTKSLLDPRSFCTRSLSHFCISSSGSRRTDRPRRNGNNTPHLVQHIATWPNLLRPWLGRRVVSVLDSGAEGPGFKSQPQRRRVTVLGKLFTPIVPLFT